MPVSAVDYRLLFGSAPALLLILRPDAPKFTIVEATDAYLAATHTRREAIIGKGLFEVFPDNPDDPTATGVSHLRASLERVLAKRSPDAMAVQKYDVRRTDGAFEERHWSPVNSPVLAPDGQVLYIQHRVEDVTSYVVDRQRADSTRERLELEIVQRSRELGTARQDLEALVAELELPILRSWPGIMTVPPIGRMDRDRLERMQQQLLHLIREERVRVVVFDLSAVSRIDPPALQKLTQIIQTAKLLGTHPLLCGLQAQAAQSLADNWGSVDFVDVLATQADALERAFALLGQEVVRIPTD